MYTKNNVAKWALNLLVKVQEITPHVGCWLKTSKPICEVDINGKKENEQMQIPIKVNMFLTPMHPLD